MITYKTILTEAVRGFNKIQNALSDKNLLQPVQNNGDSISGSVVPDEMVAAINKMTTIQFSDGSYDTTQYKVATNEQILNILNK